MERRAKGRGANASATAGPSIPGEAAARFAELDRLALDIEGLLAGLDQSVRNGETGPKDLQDKGGSARAMAKKLERGIADMKLIADEQDKEIDRDAILRRLERHEEHHKQIQVAIRKALLNARVSQQRKASVDRELLLRDSKGRSADERLRERKSAIRSAPDASLQTAKEVTDSLQRTVRLMGEEINRSAYAAKVLDESSKALQETQSEYASLSGVLRSSTTLLTRLEQRDWMDRLLILFGLLVFVLVVLYIIKKRFWIPGFATSWNLLSSVWRLLPFDDGFDEARNATLSGKSYV